MDSFALINRNASKTKDIDNGFGIDADDQNWIEIGKKEKASSSSNEMTEKRIKMTISY